MTVDSVISGVRHTSLTSVVYLEGLGLKRHLLIS